MRSVARSSFLRDPRSRCNPGIRSLWQPCLCVYLQSRSGNGRSTTAVSTKLWLPSLGRLSVLDDAVRCFVPLLPLVFESQSDRSRLVAQLSVIASHHAQLVHVFAPDSSTLFGSFAW